MSVGDLHPYDGTERRFRHHDPDTTDGVEVVTKLLRLATPVSRDALMYDLSFYSGGIGIIDRLAITLPSRNGVRAVVVSGLGGQTPDEAASDPDAKDDFVALVDAEDASVPVRDAAARFINEQRADFQPECLPSDPIWFAHTSGVNSWTALWESRGLLSYLSFDQG